MSSASTLVDGRLHIDQREGQGWVERFKSAQTWQDIVQALQVIIPGLNADRAMRGGLWTDFRKVEQKKMSEEAFLERWPLSNEGGR